MKMMVVLFAVALAVSSAAQAQWTNTPNIYGQPQYGSTWRDQHGNTIRGVPNIYGQPQYGTTWTDQFGNTTRCTPNIYGQPQYGVTCR